MQSRRGLSVLDGNIQIGEAIFRNGLRGRNRKRQSTGALLDGDLPGTGGTDENLIRRVGDGGSGGGAELAIPAVTPDQYVRIEQ